jgi:hypothetical protein
MRWEDEAELDNNLVEFDRLSFNETDSYPSRMGDTILLLGDQDETDDSFDFFLAAKG